MHPQEQGSVFPCDYCGEDIMEGSSTVYSVPIPERSAQVGVLCCPECQLSYSKYIVGNGHETREPFIREQHRGRVFAYAPPPYFVKKYNKQTYIPRSEWRQEK